MYVLMQQTLRRLRASMHRMYEQSLDDAIAEITQHHLFDMCTETIYKLTWVEYFFVMCMKVLLGTNHWAAHKAIYLRYDFHAVEVPGVVYQITRAGGRKHLTQADFHASTQQTAPAKKFPYLCVSANNSIDLTEFTRVYQNSFDRIRLTCYEFCLLAVLTGFVSKQRITELADTVEILGIKSEDLSEVVFHDDEQIEL